MDKRLGIIFGLLAIIFLSLAWKFPFKTTNLVSNLEPGPDTFYYSVPAWNWVHGRGFRMEAYGVIKEGVVKPLYGLYLIPFFFLVNDVRVYFYANLILGLLSIFWLLLFIKEIFKDSKYVYGYMLALGMFFVTNFYVYNLPSLLMSENVVLPLTILLGWLLVAKTDLVNILMVLLVVGLLLFSKSSNIPLIGVGLLFLVIKVIKKGYLKKSLIVPTLVIGGTVAGLLLWVVWSSRNLVLTDKTVWFSSAYFKEHWQNFLKVFVGGPIRYLWYDNQLISPLLGYLSLWGLITGLLVKRYRYVSGFVLMAILVNVAFFASFYSPEGRYLSTFVPLFIIGIAIFWEIGFRFLSVKFAIVPLLIVGVYLLARVDINGFHERRLTTIKRQVMNNFRENEQPWNYLAVKEYNQFFKEKDENCYFGTILNYYYFHLVFNKNCQFLPISQTQEFGHGGTLIKNNDKMCFNLPEYYKFLLKEGKSVYISNYYGSAYGGWAADFQRLINQFEVKKETDGCLGNCTIYKLVKSKKI